MVIALLAAVAVVVCLLTALPAVWLVVTGQGQVLMAVDESESHREMSGSKTYDSGGGAGQGYSSLSQNGESPLDPSI
jgi:hypothetical protein